ncbi:MAG TPA: hypothetical protein VGP56_02730 [Gaiellaceae bacterium]|nr:hypothetical protein [Gaiellaceae bacterium]
MLAAVLATAAGCGGGGSNPQTTTRTATANPKCTLSAKQRRAIQRAKRMIVEMHRLELPLKTVHEVGPRRLEQELNRFMLTIGTLPPDERGLLIRKAKSAVALCQDCFDALESAEPALATRFGGRPCKSG